MQCIIKTFQELDPKLLTMQLVPVNKPQTWEEARMLVPEFSHFVYHFTYPNMPFLCINADEGDAIMKPWKEQGMTYSQRAVHLYWTLIADNKGE